MLRDKPPLALVDVNSPSFDEVDKRRQTLARSSRARIGAYCQNVSVSRDEWRL